MTAELITYRKLRNIYYYYTTPPRLAIQGLTAGLVVILICLFCNSYIFESLYLSVRATLGHVEVEPASFVVCNEISSLFRLITIVKKLFWRHPPYASHEE